MGELESKVSIIIPVYNGDNYLQDAIESALSQTYKNCEIIVVNDGSDDDGKTERIALGYKDKIKYYFKENGGVATALNLGIEMMTGEYFSWLSHDDMYCPQKIEIELQELVRNNHENGIVFSNFILKDVEKDYDIDSNVDLNYPIEQLKRGNFAVWMGVVHGCSLLIHKSQFERVGMFNTSLKSTQDYALWYQMFQGQKIDFVSQNLIISRRHSKQGSQTMMEIVPERKDLYNYFIDNITKQDIEWEFQSEYKYCSDMVVRFSLWGFMEASNRLKDRLRELNEPKSLVNQINMFRVELSQILNRNCEKIGLFGAGYRGKEMAKAFRNIEIQIDYFFDNDTKKHETIIEGIPCISPEQIDKEKTAIIITVDNTKEIKEELKRKGICFIADWNEFSLKLFRIPCLKKKLLDI